MTEPRDRHEQMFPQLTSAQRDTAARFASSAITRFGPGETVFKTGETNTGAFLVLHGAIEIVRRGPDDGDVLVARHGVGSLTGEIGQLAARPSLAAGRAGPDGCEVVAFDPPHLRALVVGSAELGEIIMRAFILRRTALIAEGAGAVLLGVRQEPQMVRLQGFLSRNGYPYTVLDTASDTDAAAIVDKFGIAARDLPVLICPSGSLLRRPSDAEAGACLGLTPEIAADRLFDVVIVGAGPAGLATAVYAASEGLSTLVLDARAFGGQAGASARIENYLGFPTGISGQALTARAFTQAQKFGAEIAIPLTVDRLQCGGDARVPGDPFVLELSGGKSVQARAVVIASGARYRRPALSNLSDFEGAGVSYWASPVEAQLCTGEEVALVGAGNSAGQAVAFLAPRVKRLHLVIRAAGLEASMSAYLIQRIRALPNVELHLNTEIVALSGQPGLSLERVQFRNRATMKEWDAPLRHLFLFIGAEPNTEWLQGCGVEVDRHGFVVTAAPAIGPVWDAADRASLALETTVPGVFAIGDVRSGSTKRVASAVGDGAAAVAQIHSVLAG